MDEATINKKQIHDDALISMITKGIAYVECEQHLSAGGEEPDFEPMTLFEATAAIKQQQEEDKANYTNLTDAMLIDENGNLKPLQFSYQCKPKPTSDQVTFTEEKDQQAAAADSPLNNWQDFLAQLNMVQNMHDSGPMDAASTHLTDYILLGLSSDEDEEPVKAKKKRMESQIGDLLAECRSNAELPMAAVAVAVDEDNRPAVQPHPLAHHWRQLMRDFLPPARPPAVARPANAPRRVKSNAQKQRSNRARTEQRREKLHLAFDSIRESLETDRRFRQHWVNRANHDLRMIIPQAEQDVTMAEIAESGTLTYLVEFIEICTRTSRNN